MEILTYRICEEAERPTKQSSLKIRSPRDRLSLSLVITVARECSIALAWPFRALIWVYQKTFSPDHGPRQILYPYGYCKFYPSCSAFADLTLKQQGLLGFPKIIKRLLSCW